jgi:hypothetical protein
MTGKSSAASAQPAFSESEVQQRVAVLKRFKELLLEQKRRFTSYIEILDKQKNVIENGRTEDIISHVDVEEKMIADIAALQKSIEPMRFLYENIVAKDDPGSNGVVNESEISDINRALENLKTEALRQAENNKILLQKRMVLVGNELKNLRGNPFTKRKSIYADNQGATLFDISG